jgi:hypothetical protein
MLAPLVVGSTVSPSRAFASPPITGLGARGLVFPLLAEPWTGGVRACPREAVSGEQYGSSALSPTAGLTPVDGQVSRAPDHRRAQASSG